MSAVYLPSPEELELAHQKFLEHEPRNLSNVLNLDIFPRLVLRSCIYDDLRGFSVFRKGTRPLGLWMIFF